MSAAAVLLALSLSGCGAEEPSTAPAQLESQTPTPTPTPTPPPPSPAPSFTPPPIGTYPPPWLGKRVLPKTAGGFGEIQPTPPELRNRRFTLTDSVPQLPGTGFDSRVGTAPAEVIARSTWKPGCPVQSSDLDWVRLTFLGFDGKRHTGELLTNKSASADLLQVFERLWDARYPIEEMRITRADELDAPPTGDGNNTGSFACRPAVGQRVFSQHAYGLAIDVNPFQNPYVKGDLVLPELSSAYLDRSNVRPGMIRGDDPVVRAFAAIGWEWGGAWRSLLDIQHFSANGR